MQPAFPPFEPRPASSPLAWGLACVVLLVSFARPSLAGEGPALVFADARRPDAMEQAIPIDALRSACGEEDVTVEDPYHGRSMTYRAVPLRCVLDRGFASRGGAAGLADEGLLLRALDGYTRPVSGRTLLEAGGYVAFGETARLEDPARGAAFSPIDRRQVDPAPFYMIWRGPDQADPHETPWPYQLARIEVAPFEAAFPATVPDGLADEDPGWVGYRRFQRACASCHAINGQGGRVGPELNVPRSIVEYRPVAQIKAYIKNPASFRYTSMPAHPDLSEADLDALIAYFSAMRARKQDPYAGGAAASGTED
ncbi:MAG: cytochrome c [Myxococcota bacterium]